MTEETKLVFSKPKHTKGLVLKVSADSEYGGFYCNWSKHRFELVLGFVGIRLFFMSEAKYDFLQGLVTLNRHCDTHKFTSNGVKERETKDQK